jgi:mono/diheme cytochrome c family protein
MTKNRMAAGVLGGLVLATGLAAPASAADAGRDPRVERGRYLVVVSGCNDCHTPGYMQNGGPKLPEKVWLTGVPVGYQGPWGTTYASNLRLVINGMSEAQWLVHARKEFKPPMPWFNLREMTDQDLKAIYAYVRSLGAAGETAPAYVAPGGRVTTPYFVFVPQVDPPRAAAAR